MAKTASLAIHHSVCKTTRENENKMKNNSITEETRTAHDDRKSHKYSYKLANAHIEFEFDIKGNSIYMCINLC